MYWLLAGGFILSSVYFKKEVAENKKENLIPPKWTDDYKTFFFFPPAKELPFTYVLTLTCWNLLGNVFKFWECDAGLWVDVAQMAKNGSSLGSKLGCCSNHTVTVCRSSCCQCAHGDWWWSARLTRCVLPCCVQTGNCFSGLMALMHLIGCKGKCHHFRTAFVSRIYRRNFRY